MTNKQLAKIYRNAGQNLKDEGWRAYCCNAIENEIVVSGKPHDEAVAINTFASIMGNPKDVYKTEKSFLTPVLHGWFGPPTPKTQEARRIALCLAAAVVESGGL